MWHELEKSQPTVDSCCSPHLTRTAVKPVIGDLAIPLQSQFEHTQLHLDDSDIYISVQVIQSLRTHASGWSRLSITQSDSLSLASLQLLYVTRTACGECESPHNSHSAHGHPRVRISTSSPRRTVDDTTECHLSADSLPAERASKRISRLIQNDCGSHTDPFRNRKPKGAVDSGDNTEWRHRRDSDSHIQTADTVCNGNTVVYT